MTNQGLDRRELATRKMLWAKKVAKAIASSGITPNQISMLGVVMSLFSGVYYYLYSQIPANFNLFIAAVFIQLRLLCNMLDGMVAVEFNQKSKLGDLFNDVPDRFQDVFIIVGASTAVASWYGVYLGLTAALIAVLTAYVRLLGKAVGTQAYYLGPQAKQHRMFVLTLGTLLQFFLNSFIDFSFIEASLWIIAIGGLITFFRRLFTIASDLNK